MRFSLPRLLFLGRRLLASLLIYVSLMSCFVARPVQAQEQKLAQLEGPRIPAATNQAPAGPRRARIGIYVTALRDFKIAENTFVAEFWVWSVTPASGEKWNPLETIELLNATSWSSRYPSTQVRTELEGGSFGKGTVLMWHQQKVIATLSHQWDVRNYPFDRHKLEIVIEESVADLGTVVYEAEAIESKLKDGLRVEGWRLGDLKLEEFPHHYDSTFGDPELGSGEGSTYARVAGSFPLQRKTYVSFWKLTAGVYIAFVVSLLAFFFDTSQTSLMSPRMGILVGGLFAALVNMRVIESALGRSEVVALVEQIHLITIVYIFLAGVMTVASRLIAEDGKHALALRLDRRIGFWTFGASYLAINLLLILRAAAKG